MNRYSFVTAMQAHGYGVRGHDVTDRRRAVANHREITDEFEWASTHGSRHVIAKEVGVASGAVSADKLFLFWTRVWLDHDTKSAAYQELKKRLDSGTKVTIGFAGAFWLKEQHVVTWAGFEKRFGPTEYGQWRLKKLAAGPAVAAPAPAPTPAVQSERPAETEVVATGPDTYPTATDAGPLGRALGLIGELLDQHLDRQLQLARSLKSERERLLEQASRIERLVEERILPGEVRQEIQAVLSREEETEEPGAALKTYEEAIRLLPTYSKGYKAEIQYGSQFKQEFVRRAPGEQAQAVKAIESLTPNGAPPGLEIRKLKGAVKGLAEPGTYMARASRNWRFGWNMNGKALEISWLLNRGDKRLQFSEA